MAAYRGSDGRSYELGTVIRKGGEGRIHEVPALPNAVAKIWTKPSIQRARKLDALLRSRPDIPPILRSVLGLAWPSVALSDRRGATVGFLMRKVPLDRYHELVRYCIPDTRRDLEASRGSAFGRTDLMTIALNVGLLFAHLHRSGFVIGDVNHTNILAAADGKIFLIDVDSIQAPDPDTGEVYRCTVGKDDFTPPRLVGRRFEEVDRVAEDDLFGLAVLIFQILMDGCHPYDAVDGVGVGAEVRQRNIRQSFSPFVEVDIDKARAILDLHNIPDPIVRKRRIADLIGKIGAGARVDYSKLIVPRVALWRDLEPRFRDLFGRAFGNGTGRRPTALEWVLALNEAGARKPAAPPATAIPSRSPSPPSQTVKKPGTGTARKVAKRSAGPHGRSIKPQAIIGASPIMPQASPLARPAKKPPKKSGKKKSRKKSAKRSAGFAATQGRTEFSWMDLILAVSFFAGFLFILYRDAIGRMPGPAPAQSAASCASLRAEADLRGCDLSGRDLSGFNLTGADLRHSDLTSTNLEGAALDSANLADANLTRSNLKNATLAGATLYGATIEGIDLTHVDLGSTDISGIRSFNKATLRNVAFPWRPDLAGVSFVEADLSGSSIIEGNLKRADFTNARLHEASFYRSALKGATFEGAEVQNAYFFYSGLSRANMTGANAHGAFFVDADVSGVNFSESDLSNASFADANVGGANFSDADLTNAYFGSSTNVRKAIFGSTVCSDGIESDNCFLEGRLLGIHP